MPPPTDHHPIEVLRKLGTPEEIRSAMDLERLPEPSSIECNTHIHLPPNFSAFDTVEQAVGLAATQGLGVLGVSNYYDFAVYREFASECRRRRIFPLFGVEIILRLESLARAGVLVNDPGNPGKMYLCGKGLTRFDPPSGEAERLLAITRGNDDRRMTQMADRMTRIFAAGGVETGFNAQVVKDRVARRHHCPPQGIWLQERHLAQAFQETLFERAPASDRPDLLRAILGAPINVLSEDHVAIQNEIRARLMKAGKPAFVAEEFIDWDQAYRLILELGGIPCYPTLADGAGPICAFEESVEELVAWLLDHHIYCAEMISPRNRPAVLTRYVQTMRQAGIVVIAGTEHNTLESAPLTPSSLGDAPMPAEVRQIFWESVCVVAAHQFLGAHGQPGYVDSEGNLNASFASGENRIEAFHRLGAAVIRRFRQTSPDRRL